MHSILGFCLIGVITANHVSEIGICESAICIWIETRIELGVKIQIRI